MLTIVTIRRLPEGAPRDQADRLAAFSAAGEPDVTAHVMEGEPLVLSGLVRGGEIRTEEDWWFVWPVAETHVLVDASGRFVPCRLSAARASLPLTWYTFPKADGARPGQAP